MWRTRTGTQMWRTRALYGSLLLENTLGLAVAVYLLAAIAPALPKLSSAGSAAAAGSTATAIPSLVVFGASWKQPDPETLYLLVVISAAAIGATIHALTSLSTFVGNKTFVSSWTWWYVIRLPVGVGIASVLYFVLRAGFVSIGPSGGSINAYGVAAFSGLAGMFSKQAVDKLRELYDSMFTTSGDAQRKNKPDSSFAIDHVRPASLPAQTADLTISVYGRGFAAGIEASIPGGNRDVAVRDATELRVTLRSEDVATAGIIPLTLRSSAGPPSAPQQVELRVFPVITTVRTHNGDNRVLRVSGHGFTADSQALIGATERSTELLPIAGRESDLLVRVTDEDFNGRADRQLVIRNPDTHGGRSDPFELTNVQGWAAPQPHP
jgi:hypothetical protein